MTDKEIALHENNAQFSHETAQRDFRDAAFAAAGFAVAGFAAKEVIDLVLPESSFREAASSSVLALGLLTAGTVFGAGSIAAAYWRYDEIRHLKMVNELKRN